MRSLLLWLALLPSTIWALDGVVLNRTTGKPQPDVAVSLQRLGQGMEPMGAARTDAEGRFSIAHTLQGEYLLQANHQNVNYNLRIPAGSPPSNLTIEVYDASASPQARADVQVVQHMVLIEPGPQAMRISESVTVRNTGQRTYVDEKRGTFQYFVPAEARFEKTVNVKGPQGMPLTRPVTPAGPANVYAVSYPVKPGDSEFDWQYSMARDETNAFKGRILHNTGRTFLIAPNGVKLSGINIETGGKEPRTGATVYEVTGEDYAVTIEGVGMLRGPEEGAPSEEAQGPEIERAQPRIYRRMPVILGFLFSILAIGFAMLYRASSGQPERG